jgi:arylsulfatase
VLPLDNRPLAALEAPRPSRIRDRRRYVYFPHTAPVPEAVSVQVRNRTHVMAVEVTVEPGRDPGGVLLAQGSVLGGWTLYLLGGVLHYEHNVAGAQRHRVLGDHPPLQPGRHRLGFEYIKTAEFAGIGRLYVDDRLAGEAELPFTTPARFSIAGSGLTCGYEVGPAVSLDYDAPFRFTGTIHRAVIDVGGDAYRDLRAELAAILSYQ